MKLEDQVANLQLSKRLKELDVNQKSLFYWNIWEVHGGETQVTIDDERKVTDSYSAFTASELGEMLPAIIGNEYYLTIIRLDQFHHWGTDYRDWKTNDSYAFIDSEAETMADSMAKMLIHLIESGVVKV